MNKAEKTKDVTPEMKFSGVYTFIKTVVFEGTTLTEVKYDFDSLKAKDVKACKRELARLNGGMGSGEPLMTDDALHAALFARAADLPVNFVDEMGAADYGGWAVVGQAFFASALSGLMT